MKIINFAMQEVSSIFNISLDSYDNYKSRFDEFLQSFYSSKYEEVSLQPTSRKNVIIMARRVAYNKLKKMFDIERSFQENGGDQAKLNKDMTKLFWWFYREEVPTKDVYYDKINYYQLLNTSYHQHQELRKTRNYYMVAKEKQQRKLAKEKKISKEQEYRNKIGDEEFNRRMVVEKKIKSEKGGSDVQYLAYLEWRKTKEGLVYDSPVGEESKLINAIHHSIYNQKLSRTRSQDNSKTDLRVSKLTFNSILNYVLLHKKNYAVDIKIHEGKTNQEIPKQYVLFNNVKLSLNAAKRQQVVQGTITHWYNDSKYMFVSFDKQPTGYHRVYPKEWAKFENYKDPVNGQFVGNPKKESHAHKFYKVCGKDLVLTIYNNYSRYTVRTSTFPNLAHTKDYLQELMTGKSSTKEIEDRLKTSINKDKKARAKVYKQENKLANKATVDQFMKISTMYTSGVITLEQFNSLTKKLDL